MQEKEQHRDQPVDEPSSREHTQVPQQPRHAPAQPAGTLRQNVNVQGAGLGVATIGAMVKAVDGSKDRQGDQDEEQKELSDAVVERPAAREELLVRGLVTDAVRALQPALRDRKGEPPVME